MNESAHPPLQVKNRGLVLAVLLLGTFAAVMNMSVTNVALPSIAKALDAEGSAIAWISDAFSIALTSFVLLSGAIGDRYGRRQMYLLGALLAIPGSLASAVAGSTGFLIGARFFTGLAIALLFPTTLSFITGLYTDLRERMGAVGAWAGVASAGAALGPVIGGVLLEHFWWGSVFLVAVPVLAVAVVVGWFALPHDGGVPGHRVDWMGGAISVVFVASLLFAVIEWPIEGLHGKVLAALVLAVATGVLFVRHELKVPQPLLNVRALLRPRFGLAALTVTIMFFTSFGYSFLTTQFFQNVLDWSPLKAGVAGLPSSLAMLVFSQVATKIDLPWGSNRVVAVGMLTMAAAFLITWTWGVDTTYPIIGFGMLLLGAGVGLTATPCTNAIMNSLPPEEAGVGSAVNDVTRDFGGAIGVAVFGAVSSVYYSRYISKLFDALPADVRDKVSDDIVLQVSRSLNGALVIADRYKDQYPEASAKLVEAAGQGWLAGQGAAMSLGAAVCVVVGAAMYRFLPRAEEAHS
ncbi:MAG: MFS transporter [Acidobacteria bacterium]|nr:MFS transporter [Acidobacteriota bacterium]